MSGSDDYALPEPLQGGAMFPTAQPHCAGAVTFGTVHERTAMVADELGWRCPVCGLIDAPEVERTLIVRDDPALGTDPDFGGRVAASLRTTPGTVAVIPHGCAALWHAEGRSVDKDDILARAGLAARRTHTDQAVLLPDGTVKVIPGGVPGITTSPGGDYGIPF